MFSRKIQAQFKQMLEPCPIPMSEFKWGPIKHSVMGGMAAEGLTHKPTGLWIAFAPDINGGVESLLRCWVFPDSSGSASYVTSAIPEDFWGTVQAWLARVIEEQELPDPWSDIQSVLVRSAEEAGVDEPFTEEERRVVEVEWAALFLQMERTLKGKDDEIARLRGMNEDLSTALTRSTKRQFRRFLLGVFAEMWVQEGWRQALTAAAPHVDKIIGITSAVARLVGFTRG